MPETSRDVVVVLLDETTFTVPVKVRLLLLYTLLHLGNKLIVPFILSRAFSPPQSLPPYFPSSLSLCLQNLVCYT